ncbi:MAG: hypothetical protein U9Q38_02630, partial [Thermodesulfobacteriota bacterium]|nr:hypothetical protein [Thermodesulfobacteriota bacterium]
KKEAKGRYVYVQLFVNRAYYITAIKIAPQSKPKASNLIASNLYAISSDGSTTQLIEGTHIPKLESDGRNSRDRLKDKNKDKIEIKGYDWRYSGYTEAIGEDGINFARATIKGQDKYWYKLGGSIINPYDWYEDPHKRLFNTTST